MTEVNPSATQPPPDSIKEQTPSKEAPPAITDEQVKNHPLFKDLEGKYSAEEREKTRFKGRYEKARQGILDDEEKPEPGPKEESPYATKEELWEMKNAKDLEIYADDEYRKDIDSGIPRDYALKNAKLRFQANPDKARSERVQTMASGSAAGVRDLSSIDESQFNEEEAKRWGYSKESWMKQQELKKKRGQL